MTFKDTTPPGKALEETNDSPDSTDSPESSERRKAVTKLAYASPVVAGILFSQRAAAQFSGGNLPPPPPPPGG